MTREVVFNPRDFIRDPYIDCPRCGAKGAFGVIFVSGHAYARKCKACLEGSSFPLPRLTKKLIYLDQFAVSDMMKATNPNSKAYREGRVNPFWRELFERLHRLCRWQLIACPESEFHERESAVWTSRSDLQRLLKRLSAGIRFRDHITIQRFQIHQQVRQWVAGGDPATVDVRRKDGISGDPSAWTNVFIVSMNVGDPEGYIEELRRSREESHEVMQALFERWRVEGKTFEECFLEESRRWALALPHEYLKHLEEKVRAYRGEREMTLDLMFPPSAVDMMRAILYELESAGVTPEDIVPKTLEYLASGVVDWLPANRLRSALCATLATQARNGRKPPERGMFNDIEMISTLLPYADAIFVDRECHGLLRSIPAAYRPNYPCRVFSFSNKDDFLAYLGEIEAGCSEEHKAKLREVYGERVDR